ncbi:MAG: DUF2493 domain-containing protein [Alcanivorax sp.]|nr:DUF2493 domain-containing protein [Alcanivorax sp.]
MRILVCGGRDFHDLPLLHQTLETLRRRGLLTLLIHGDANGTDRLASRWAHDQGVDQVCYPANWQAHGRAAGPLRNQRMLQHGKPQAVVAFPGGRGTAHMIGLAERASVPVWQPSQSPVAVPFS